MGTGKKEAARRERQGNANDGMSNVKVKGENFYRNAKKIKVLNRLKEGKPQRNAQGQITRAASYQSKEIPKARIEPNRKWFTNSRVISQESLAAFRDAVARQTSDPNSYLLKTNKLPMSLIRDDSERKNGIKQHKAKIVVETASFSDTFGPKAQRKRPKVGSSTFGDLAGETVKMHEDYLERLEQAKLLSGNAGAEVEEQGEGGDEDGTLSVAREAIFSKGQSKRIWNELYKVIDSSDVIIHVLDARDPLGTRCRAVEKYLKEEAPHKHLVFVLNKCDLVPTGVAAAWVKHLSTEYPTLAFHASLTNSFGKGSLIALLRQFAILHASRKQISAGFIGYPNTGKSSIINTLRSKAVCKTAPIPGETKVWQYITLTRRIYLIDCPGVVPPSQSDSDAEILLRGVVRTENVQNPAQYVGLALARCQRKHVERTYDVRDWADAEEFLERLARKSGRLLRGGEADVDGVAKVVLNDFLRGRLPWFTPPPMKQDGEGKGKGEKKSDGDDGVGLEGREGRLGEISRKRKREDVQGMLADGDGRMGKDAEGESAEADGEASDSEESENDAELVDGDEESGDSDHSEDEEAEFEGFGDGIAVDPDTIGWLGGCEEEPSEAESQSPGDDRGQTNAAEDGATLVDDDDQLRGDGDLVNKQRGTDEARGKSLRRK